MFRWLTDPILKAFNYVPELILARDDPHFDVVRWWFVFVLVVVLVLVGMRVLRAFRAGRSSAKPR